jgi:dTDP-4-amino-4,6-dideoxygalactose transaminase
MMQMGIPFNKPFLTGKETPYILEAVHSGRIAGDGLFTKKCHQFFENQLGFRKVLLTTSCTDALEMAAILLDIKEGDEVIAPSYTFVSTVNPFILRGAKIIFADSRPDNPNIDADLIESLITPRTKAIIPVHYAGIACDMDRIMELARKHGIFVVEDAAQSIDSFHNGVALGSIGALGAFSFHETKNIISGEGGLLTINNERFVPRAEIIREKGTNRSAFSRGEIDKYRWVDIGSSFLPSDIIAAFLFAQLENLTRIQDKRKRLWSEYNTLLMPLAKAGFFEVPFLPSYATNNGHVFYIVLKNTEQRGALIEWLKSKNIQTVFHYLSLHKSPFYEGKYSGKELVNADRYSDCLLRLPLYFDLATDQVQQVCREIGLFFEAQ